jgi:anaerobic magnesium-protoporphyrin IX monomethyl ester cyclase
MEKPAAMAAELAKRAMLAPSRSLSIVLVRPASMLPGKAQNAVLEIAPIGLAYLAASLEEAGHRVRIIDAFGEAVGQLTAQEDGYVTNGLTAEEIVARIPRDVDLIGVTCMFSNSWLYVRRTIAAIAAAFPEVPLIVGGEHPTADYDRLLRQMPEVLCCVLGEGEETAVDIAAHLSLGMPLDDVPGIALRGADGTVVCTPRRSRIRAIDDIPRPSWNLVPLHSYLDNDLCSDAWVGRSIPMLTSRGCPYQCTFCSSPQMFGTLWLVRDARKVVDEMKHYKATYGVDYFEFVDLTVVVRRDWIIEFCNLLIEEKMDVQWSLPSGTRSEALDAEALGLMKQSGCRSFSYAAESGSPAELRRIKKKIEPERMLESMRAATNVGLVTKCHLIFGLPDQTPRDVIKTLGFVTKIAWAGVSDLGCYAFSPYPGSELYARLVAEGRIDREAEDYDRVLAANVFTNYKLRRSWTPHIATWALPWICLGTMAYFYVLQFLFRPQRALALAESIRESRPHTYLQRMLVKKLHMRRPLVASTPPVVASRVS